MLPRGRRWHLARQCPAPRPTQQPARQQATRPLQRQAHPALPWSQPTPAQRPGKSDRPQRSSRAAPRRKARRPARYSSRLAFDCPEEAKLSRWLNWRDSDGMRGCYSRSGHRVIARTPPWVAAGNAAQGQAHALHRPMAFDGSDGIGRTAWRKSATGWQYGRKRHLPQADRPDQD